jgi:hypothetical protein
MDDLRELAPGGRRGAGTVNHCIHGRDVLVEEVLEWRPFDTLTTRMAMPMPGAPKVTSTDVFLPAADGGTDVEVRIGLPKPRERAAFARVMEAIEPNYRASVASLERLLEDEARRRAGADEPESEPPLPASRGRFLAEPVHRPAGSVDLTASRSSPG